MKKGPKPEILSEVFMKENETESKAFSKSIIKPIPSLLYFLAQQNKSYMLHVNLIHPRRGQNPIPEV